MNKLIEFNVPGGTVVVESQDAVTGSPVRGAALTQVAEQVGRSLEDVLAVIRPVANAALATCRDLVVMPDTVEVDFSVKFDASFGAVIAQTSAEGSLHIKLAWKPA
jgi:anaerobic C4-dicarboxylate transporter